VGRENLILAVTRPLAQDAETRRRGHGDLAEDLAGDQEQAQEVSHGDVGQRVACGRLPGARNRIRGLYGLPTDGWAGGRVPGWPGRGLGTTLGLFLNGLIDVIEDYVVNYTGWVIMFRKQVDSSWLRLCEGMQQRRGFARTHGNKAQ